jgi:hypothetical protein
VALAANPFHSSKITGSGATDPTPAPPRVASLTAGRWPHRWWHLAPPQVAGTLELCTLRFGWWQSTWTAPCCRTLRRP